MDIPRLKAQLPDLVRQARSRGRHTVDHKQGGYDDLSNVVAVALVLVAAGGVLGVVEFFKQLDRGEIRLDPMEKYNRPPAERETGFG